MSRLARFRGISVTIIGLCALSNASAACPSTCSRFSGNMSAYRQCCMEGELLIQERAYNALGGAYSVNPTATKTNAQTAQIVTARRQLSETNANY